MRGLAALYLLRERDGRYDRHLALGMAAMVGVPVLAGAVAGRTDQAVVVSLGAWLASLAEPRATPAGRLRQLLFRSALLTGTTWVGLLVGDRLWAVLLASAVLCLLAPLAAFGVTPLIALVMATGPQPVAGTREHLLLFGAGTLWAAAILLVPFLGGPYGTPPPERPEPPPRAPGPCAELRRAVAVGDPRVRYAVRICVCFTATYAALTLLDVPHAGWALIGIATTLRPSWGATRTRIAKRLVGLVLGCALAVALLALTSGRPLAEAVALTVCAGIARPMRGWNYGFWPVFGTPVLLLLTDFTAHVVWSDVLQRLANNALGAGLAAVTVLYLWPARAERRIPERLQTLLETHARFLERVATVAQYGPAPARERRVRVAEQAAGELRAALDGLDRPHPDAAAALAAADRLRSTVTAYRPYETSGLPARELRRGAARLDTVAARLTGMELGTTGEAARRALDEARARVPERPLP
ncbi:FUSC family protein [Streptomyces subrutilus]|uniref:FUSC family protein n=1 Tax=Streptomyces subrutilus TaxID=36818 RepID=UPI002E0DD462|nr:FUSC family protein [Streptomyces subrutilus]